MFSRLKNGETGIDFINKNIDTDTLNILDYLYYYNGAGVAIGDINNDGLPDIYFASNTGNNKLYLNKGNFQFEDITDKAGVSAPAGWKTGVTMADINGDGYLDIYVCVVGNLESENPNRASPHTYFSNAHNLLFLNNGNNTFTESSKEWGLDAQGFNTQAVFFDYDKDGDLDMFLLQHSTHQVSNYKDSSSRSAYSKISGGKLFRNDGGHFTDVTKGSGIISSSLGYGLGVGVADLNHDGYDDIYVSNDFHENDYYYVNQGNGTFKEMNRDAFQHESRYSMGNDIADINNDGWPDIMTLDMLPEDEKILKSSLGDESLDIYNFQSTLGYHHQYSRNCLQLNIGRGKKFADIALFSGVAATDWSWSTLIADYNNDGTDDIFITNGIKKRQNDLDYIKFSSNGYDPATTSKDEFANKDQEMVNNLPGGALHNYIFEGNTDLKFNDRSIDWGLEKPTLSQGAVYADLDNDGALDLVTNDMNDLAGIYKNNARNVQHSFHYLTIQLKGKQPNTLAVGAKVFVFKNHKVMYQELQPVRGFMSSSEPILHYGLGLANNVDSIVVIWPNNTYQKLIGIKADQRLVINCASQKNDTIVNHFKFVSTLLHQPASQIFTDITIKLGIHFNHQEDISFNDFNRQPFMPHQLSTQGPKITVGDINQDGLDDFFVCGAKNQAGKLYVQQKDGTFISTNDSLFGKDAAHEEVDALFFDANNDGAPDLYVVSGGYEYYGPKDESKTDLLYINDGHGNFAKSKSLPLLYEDKSVVRAADFNGDGYLDLFVGGRANNQFYGGPTSSYLLLNDGKGNFSVVTDDVAKGLGNIGMVTDACWSDVNKDGKPDLIIVGEWMAPTVFINDNGKLERQRSSLDELTGWWTCIKNIDINGDGYEDLLLGNFGLNSKLHGSSSFPLKMYIGDFDNNGIYDQILCAQKSGNYFPFLGKEELEKKLPYLKKDFLSYGKMAGKTVEEIFADKLNTARLLQCATLQSVVLINDRKGGFTSRPLPGSFQWAPLFSFANEDFNHDGKKDLLVGADFYGTTPYEGRYDALPISFYKGNGKGDFELVLPLEEALQNIRGELRSIQAIRLIGNKRALIIGVNNGPLTVLQY